MNNDTLWQIPADEEIRILKRIHRRVDGFNVLEESWVWEGISGRSLIIPLCTITDIPDEHLVEILSKHFIIKHPYTFQKKNGYLFVNHDFVSSY